MEWKKMWVFNTVCTIEESFTVDFDVRRIKYVLKIKNEKYKWKK